MSKQLDYFEEIWPKMLTVKLERDFSVHKFTVLDIGELA
jgi:hypothetical protein